ncbi:Gfo/Idh/MocA family oxidoreductase [Asanoa sp. NPDC050611]|uniref:Gfo/Idh/MocA family protein n=1 Tax=Asanoa sp. NPDC050611 TaxID=3157098 RepID=UPI0033D5BF12
MRPRVAVIGVGAFGAAHVAAYQAQDVEVVGVADADRARAAGIAQRYGIPGVFDDGHRLLDALRPDGVSVVTPAGSHVPLARHAVDLGCRVLLEKPIAEHPADLDQLPASAAELVVPGHVLRFDAAHRRLREIVGTGLVGRVVGISACRDRASWHLDRYPDTHPALLTAVHDIDLALWVGGTRAATVVAHAPRAGLVFAQVTAADGAVWSIRTSWLLPGDAAPSDEFAVHGTAGVATVRVGATGTTLTAPSPEHEVAAFPVSSAPGLAEEIAHFVTLLRTRRPSDVVSLTEAAHVVRVAAAIVESAAEGGRPVVIPPEETR